MARQFESLHPSACIFTEYNHVQCKLQGNKIYAQLSNNCLTMSDSTKLIMMSLPKDFPEQSIHHSGLVHCTLFDAKLSMMALARSETSLQCLEELV